jgi:hypothetical protein
VGPRLVEQGNLPYVAGTVPRHLADSPARHVRRALRLLDELEDDLRHPDSSMLGRHDRVGLVVVARRRLRLAAAALRSDERPRRALLRKLVPVGVVILKVVVLVFVGAGLMLRVLSWSMRSVVRLVFAFRAI